MKKRSKMSSRHSKKLFTKTADWVHARNAPDVVMRGGIRL